MNPMFPDYNRPGIFSGKWGNAFFMGLGFWLMVLPLILLIWSFINITWYINVFLIAGSFAVTDICLRLFRNILLSTAFSPILSFIVLAILNAIAWLN